MTAPEGFIKFELEFSPAPPRPADELCKLNAWRGILYRLGLIGRDPARYGGAGYGNVSHRLAMSGAEPCFIVSGSQTGALALPAR